LRQLFRVFSDVDKCHKFLWYYCSYSREPEIQRDSLLFLGRHTTLPPLSCHFSSRSFDHLYGQESEILELILHSRHMFRRHKHAGHHLEVFYDKDDFLPHLLWGAFSASEHLLPLLNSEHVQDFLFYAVFHVLGGMLNTSHDFFVASVVMNIWNYRRLLLNVKAFSSRTLHNDGIFDFSYLYYDTISRRSQAN